MERQSAIYEGRVRHRRFAPKNHEFSYPIILMFLDLSELEEIFDGSWIYATDRKSPVAFRRSDHLGDPEKPLDESVRDLVEERTGRRPIGSIRLLTQLAHFGRCFNPVSFYYIYSAHDPEILETIVAEVHNTPWRERYCYVLDCREVEGEAASAEQSSDKRRGSSRHILPKAFHVSPFMPMDIQYDWRFSAPGRRLAVHMENWRQDNDVITKQFDATMTLSRREITPSTLRGAFFRFPLQAFSVVASIYYQAFKLWWKRVPFYPHPGKAGSSPTT